MKGKLQKYNLLIKQNDKKKSENKQRKGKKRDKKNSNETRMMSAWKSSGQRPKNCGQETFVESKVYSDHHKNERKRATAKINSLLLIYNRLIARD